MNELLAALQRLFGQVIFWATIDPWEQAIRVRAGKHVRRLRPGFHLRVPILDVIHKQSVRLRSSLLPGQTLSTSDGHTLFVGAGLGYAISDIEKLYRGLRQAEDTIAQLAGSALAAEVLATARHEARPDAISAQVEARLAEALSPFGIADVAVRVTDFAFVRSFRLIQEGRWRDSRALSTEAPS